MKTVLNLVSLLFLLSCDRCLEDYDCLTCHELEKVISELKEKYNRARTYDEKVAVQRDWEDALDCCERSCQRNPMPHSGISAFAAF